MWFRRRVVTSTRIEWTILNGQFNFRFRALFHKEIFTSAWNHCELKLFIAGVQAANFTPWIFLFWRSHSRISIIEIWLFLAFLDFRSIFIFYLDPKLAMLQIESTTILVSEILIDSRIDNHTLGFVKFSCWFNEPLSFFEPISMPQQ